MENNYTAINASAGSGKTYTLVQRILLICLRHPDQEKNIGQILALTFTNKAANEMKERILRWLQKFSAPDYPSNADFRQLLELLRSEKYILDAEELHRRCQKLLDYILHYYSVLNIGTIDKFNARLVRSFANELGLAQNFNLEINPEPFLIEAVDRVMENIGADNPVSSAFMDFVHYSLDNDEKLRISETLYASAKEYVNDIHHDKLQRNKDFGWDNYENAKRDIRKQINELKKEIERLVDETFALVESKDLTAEDFSGGNSSGILLFFKKYREESKITYRESIEEEERYVARYRKGHSSAGKSKAAAVASVIELLLENRIKIIKNGVEIKKLEQILAEILPLKVNKEIQDELQKIEQDNDLVLISKFNILINENLSQEPSAFIYEKVGTKFQHFFLDEFQDTSTLQWKNIVPLRDNALSDSATSFTLVGDPKQSIYRFRGGDSQLMTDIIQHKENGNIRAEVINLKDNFRSAKNIVDFNNKLYQYLGENGNMQEGHREVFAVQSVQNPRRKDVHGRVRVSLFENQTKPMFYENVAAKMADDIQNLLDCGYRLSDITILCRGKDEIASLSAMLNATLVQYGGQQLYINTISDSGLSLEISNTVRALIYFLRWRQSPDDRRNLVLMLYFLNETGRIELPDLTESFMEMLSYEDDDLEDFLLSALNVNLKTPPLQLNFYRYVEHYLQEFSVAGQETDFILNFLEMLYNYSQNQNGTLKDFLLYWDEEGRKTRIQSSDSVDAIKLMTIHKAKGLEFPVVMLPMLNDPRPKAFSDWFDIEPQHGLHTVNIKKFPNVLATYDEAIEKFNNENTYLEYIDKMCLHYVATTRPVQQLHLYLERPRKDKSGIENEGGNEIYKFVKEHNPTDAAEFDIYDYDPALLNVRHDEEIKNYEPVQPVLKNHRRHQDNLKVATPSKNYQQRNEAVRQGIFVHEILEKIKRPDDLDIILKKFVLDGTITCTESEDVKNRISKIFDQYPQFFADGLEVISEKDIMMSDQRGNKTYRPDRLVKLAGGWWILDYKTGADSEKYELQLQSYQQLLESFGFHIAGTQLIYV